MLPAASATSFPFAALQRSGGREAVFSGFSAAGGGWPGSGRDPGADDYDDKDAGWKRDDGDTEAEGDGSESDYDAPAPPSADVPARERGLEIYGDETGGQPPSRP